MPHQRETVAWMYQRESCRSQPKEFPFLIQLETSENIPYGLDLFLCRCSWGITPKYQDIKGGVLGDDTGLGKTVAVIALVLMSSTLLGPVQPKPSLNAMLASVCHMLIEFAEAKFDGKFVECGETRLDQKGQALYHATITTPMSLAWMSEKAMSRHYSKFADFKSDFDLMLSNHELFPVFYNAAAIVSEFRAFWDGAIASFIQVAMRSLAYVVLPESRTVNGVVVGSPRLRAPQRKRKLSQDHEFVRTRSIYRTLEGIILLRSLQGGRLPLQDLDEKISLKTGIGLSSEARWVFRTNATLVVVPSEDLVKQWAERLKQFAPVLPVHYFYRGTHHLDYFWFFDVHRPTLSVSESSPDMISIDRRPPEKSPTPRTVVVICTLPFISGINRNTSTLKMIHWRRVVVDESQVIGKTTISNRLRLLCDLITDYRWVVTGTPTADKYAEGNSSDLTYFEQQLMFLKEPVWSYRFRVLKDEWQLQTHHGFWWLCELFQRTVMRHDKRSTGALREKTEHLVPFVMLSTQIGTYNAIAHMAARNLLYAHFDPTEGECYLNPQNIKYAKNMLDDIRRACCISGHVDVHAPTQDVRDVQELLLKSSLVNEPNRIETSMAAVAVGIGECACCSVMSQLPIVTPCGHLLCIRCARPCFPAVPKTFTPFTPEECKQGSMSCYQEEPEDLQHLNLRDRWLRCTQVQCPVTFCGAKFSCEDLDQLQVGYSMVRANDSWHSSDTVKCRWLIETLSTPAVRAGCSLLYSTLIDHHVVIAQALEAHSIGFVRYSKSAVNLAGAEGSLFNVLRLSRKDINREALIRYNRGKFELAPPLLPPGLSPSTASHFDSTWNTPTVVPESFHGKGIWTLQVKGATTSCVLESAACQPFGEVEVAAEWFPTPTGQDFAPCSPIVVVLSLNTALGFIASDELDSLGFLTVSPRPDPDEPNRPRRRELISHYRKEFTTTAAAQQALRALNYTPLAFVFGERYVPEAVPRARSRMATLKIMVRWAEFGEEFDFQDDGFQGDGIITSAPPLPAPVQFRLDTKAIVDLSTRVYSVEEPKRVLLMDEAGALALDLFHTTHVFLMEPIPDRNEENQVIGRAYRFTSTHRPVDVFKLYVSNTVEEFVYKGLQSTLSSIAPVTRSSVMPLCKEQQLRDILFNSLFSLPCVEPEEAKT